MKKFYYFTIVSLFSATMMCAHAQQSNPIPNSSFENWTTSGNQETLNGWNALSVTAGPINYPLSSISKSNDAQHGTYAVLLETKELDAMLQTILTQMGLTNISVLPSIMSVGKINAINIFRDLFSFTSDPSFDITTLLQTLMTANMSDYINGGIALNGLNPTQLHGHYKYVSEGDDNGMAIVFGSYYDATAQKRILCGGGMAMLSPESSYTEFAVEYTPLSATQPDSIEILFLSSGITSAQSGSKLYIDNLNLIGANSISIALNQPEIRCYPNPSSGMFTLSMNSNEKYTVNVYNSIGQKVWFEKDCVNGTHFQLHQTGVYVLEMLSNNGKSTQTIVVK